MLPRATCCLPCVAYCHAPLLGVLTAACCVLLRAASGLRWSRELRHALRSSRPLLSPEQGRERRALLDMALDGDVGGVPVGAMGGAAGDE